MNARYIIQLANFKVTCRLGNGVRFSDLDYEAPVLHSLLEAVCEAYNEELNALATSLREEFRGLRRENELLTAPRIVHITPDNCWHNREIDPVSGECSDCGEVLP